MTICGSVEIQGLSDSTQTSSQLEIPILDATEIRLNLVLPQHEAITVVEIGRASNSIWGKANLSSPENVKVRVYFIYPEGDSDGEDEGDRKTAVFHCSRFIRTKSVNFTFKLLNNLPVWKSLYTLEKVEQ